MMDINTMIKKCTKCKEPKDIEKFYFRSKLAGTRRPVCKECMSHSSKRYYIENKNDIIKQANKYYNTNKESILRYREIWRKNNKEKISDANKQYRKNNVAKIHACNRSYYQKNSKSIKGKVRIYRENNKLCINARNREYYLKNNQRIKDYQREYRSNNKESINAYFKHRRNTDNIFRLRHNISAGIRSSLRANKDGRSWENMLGYTAMDLKDHVEKQFQKDMSWKNYGKWHIDHCRPVSWFSNDEKGVLAAWELSNLQPMWACENMSKGNRWESPRKIKATKQC